MFIVGLGTAAPPNRYTQVQCWEAFQGAAQFAQLDRRARATLQKVLLHNNGIHTRSLALDSLDEVFAADPDTLHRRFARHAPLLASRAATDALQQSGLRPHDIDAVIISSCTGYLCPGLTSYVAERLGLKPNVLALDLVGQGCGAALPNLRTAEAPNSGTRRVEWKAAGSLTIPAERDALRFEHKNGMLRNILTPQVPVLAAQCAETVLDDVLSSGGMSRSEISAWIWHAGGRKVLEALQERIGLTAADVHWSSQVLSEFGNLSSPFVYFVLQAALRHNAPGGCWWMSSFGAGFSCHGALLKVA